MYTGYEYEASAGPDGRRCTKKILSLSEFGDEAEIEPDDPYSSCTRSTNSTKTIAICYNFVSRLA
jgi:hypothetical protein